MNFALKKKKKKKFHVPVCSKIDKKVLDGVENVNLSFSPTNDRTTNRRTNNWFIRS